MDLNSINIMPCPKLGLTSSDVRTILKKYYSGISTSRLESEYNVTPRKTGNLNDLPQIRHDLVSHFIRGFFDGDGSISRTGPKFSIIGDYNFLLKIQSILIEHCHLNKTKFSTYPHKIVDIYNLSYSGKKQIHRIFTYLYKDATVYLNRKYETFIQILS